MQKHIRQSLIQSLWERYFHANTQMQKIAATLQTKGMPHITLDHFAVIDLPGPHTGIPHLCQIFESLGYSRQGEGYLPEKQNDFLWLAETDSIQADAASALPQVVVADFRLDQMPLSIRTIIEKYSTLAPPSPIQKITDLAKRAADHELNAEKELMQTLTHYFSGRDWPLPTLREFNAVREFNELLAWVLVFGRLPNHFTVAVHHLPAFDDIDAFNHFVESELKLELNYDGGKIKGGKSDGIAQGSTTGQIETIQLSDGVVQLPMGFVEFVFRYARDPAVEKPHLWCDYYNGFISQYANHVIQSLYVDEKKYNLCESHGSVC